MVDSKHNKRLLYWLALPVMIILVLSGLFYLYMNSENFRENVKTILTTQLENNLGKKIEIGTVDSISFRSIKLSHFIVFENTSDKNRDILFQAEQLIAGFKLFFPLFQRKNWQLDIQDITFYQASAVVTRESTGEFDLIKKLHLDLEKVQENLIVHRIHFQNSQLVYQDELVYNYNLDYLTTRVRDINGFFDLSQLPKISFDFQGMQENDHALLALQGQFLINQPEYSLDFHLEDADITHFQYYLEVAEQFEVSQGTFNLDLNLSFPSELDPSEIFWQGNATFQQVNAAPNFLQQIPFKNISGSVQFKKPEITISELKGIYRNKVARLGGLVMTEPQVYFNLDLKSEGVDASHLKNDISLFVPDYTDFSLQGKLDLTANINGLLEDFQIECQVSSPEIIIENISFKKSDCSFLLHSDELIIHSLEAYDPEGYFIISGQVNWPDGIPFYHLSLQTENLAFQHPIIKQFSFLQDVSGKIDSRFQIDSQEQDNSILDIEGQCTVNSVKMKEFSLPEPLEGDIKAFLHYSDSILSIEQCELKSGKNNGSIKGEINLDELILFTVNFGCHLPELNQLAGSLGLEEQLAGKADIQGTIEGNAERPEIKAEFHLQEFLIQEYLLGELTGELFYQKDMITLEALTLTNHDIKLAGVGKILLNESSPPEIELSYQFPGMAIDKLIGSFTNTFPLSGQASGTGHIQGIWPELTMQGNVQLEQVTYQNYPLGQGQFNFNLQPEPDIGIDNEDDKLTTLFSWLGHSYSLELEQFNLQNETMQLMAKGETKIGDDFPFSLEIELTHQTFNEMIENFYPIDNDLEKFLPSQINGKANLTGNISQQQIVLSALLIPQQQENNPHSQLESSFMINEQGIIISDFRLIQSEGHLKAEGNISPVGNLNIVFQSEQLDMNTLMSLAQIDETMNGIMNIEGSCQGTLDQLQVSMTAQIKQGYFREFQFEDLQSDLQWNSKTNIIEIKKLVIALEKDYQIQAKGNFPLSTLFDRDEEEMVSEIIYQEIPLDFQIRMEKADLNLIRLFWKDAFAEVMGNIDLELFFNGTAGTPIVNGTMDIHQGRVTLKNFPIQVEELNTRIEVSENQIVIPVIPFTAYENRFTLSGQLELIRLNPEKLFLTIRNDQKKVFYQNILETEADFITEITGSLLDPKMNGQLLLSKGELNIQNLLLLNENEEIDIPLPPAQGMTNTFTSEQLNLNIEINDPFKLKMPNAEIEVSGRLSLIGSLAEPALQGNLVLKKGYLLYFEKRFTLLDGLVTINGFKVVDIGINARANTTVQDIQIMISIQGNLANPQILLSSQPSLKETEILSLLTFDRNIQGLSNGEINQLLSQEMIDIIFQSLQINLFKRMERELAEGLGLEFIHLSYDNSENSGSQLFFLEDLNLGDLKLEIGKSISDELLITYSTPLDFHGETSLGMEYQFSSDFTFTTQFDTYSFTGEDYRFKFGLEIRF